MQGRSQGGGAKGAFAPPFFQKDKFYLYLNELLPQIVDLVVLTLGKYHTKAGNKAVLIADPARARRYSVVWASWHEYRECGFLIVGVVSGRKFFPPPFLNSCLRPCDAPVLLILTVIGGLEHPVQILPLEKSFILFI